MTTQKLKAVELVRHIRDRHYEQLKDATHAERIAFYRQQAQELFDRLHLPMPSSEQHKAEDNLA